MALIGTDNDRRRITARWTITAHLEMTSASQIGHHESAICDSTFARDVNGSPILPGTTLAGALRSQLSDRRAGKRSLEGLESRSVFGSMTDRESPIIVFDSIGGDVRTTIRDGVSIDPKTGTARPGHKYDRELALPGLVFPIRFDIVITAGTEELAIVSELADVLDALARGEVRLGARTSRGLGACKAAKFRAIRYDLKHISGWESYANSDYESPTATRPEFKIASVAIADALNEPLDQRIDMRRNCTIRFELQVASSLLVRSPGIGALDPDTIHLTEAGKQVLSGTSVAGVLRAHTGRLLNTLNANNMNPTGVVLSELFGPDPDDVKSKGSTPAASRVEIDEALIDAAQMHDQTRVKIDRFTGGAIDTALFDERPSVGGRVRLDVRIVISPSDSPAIEMKQRAEIALLLLTARDFAQGLVPVGGGSSVGRGVMTGQVNIQLPNSQNWLDLSTAGTELEPYIRALTMGAAQQ